MQHPNRATISLLALVFTAILIASGCDSDAGPSLACDPDPSGGNVLLVDHDLWTLAPPDDDPWAAFRPADDITCPEGDRLSELFAGTDSYAILTPRCPYTTVTQTTLADICAGDRFYFWFWHFELTAPENTTAHLGVVIGDEEIYAKELPIPSSSGLITDEVVIPDGIPAGTPIYYHLRNHGSNSYNLIELSLKR